MTDESVTGEPPRGGPLFGVFLLSNLTVRVLEPTLRPIGITAGEYGLHSLLRMVGPITPSEVANRGGMAATTVSYPGAPAGAARPRGAYHQGGRPALGGARADRGGPRGARAG